MKISGGGHQIASAYYPVCPGLFLGKILDLNRSVECSG